ncbi:MAG: transcriptional regulator with XRE-family HTH domain [Myxococcota bacterium]|jgi:transcriptional regulator with XRE-family HTH domain
MTEGVRLRGRREELGWAIADVAQRTRIPLAHLEAIEEDRRGDIPAGPWADRYRATLERLYGLPHTPAPDLVEVTHPVRRAGLPLRTVRLLAAVTVLALLGALALQLWTEPSLVPGLEGVLTPAAELPDQHLRITTRRNLRLTVTVDGEVALDRECPGGSVHEFDALNEIVVTVPATEAVQLRYNGEGIIPLGRRTTPRVLRFVDDGEPGT